MMSPEKILIIWVAVMSVVAVIATVSDKIKSKLHSWRTPEAVLLGISALGGSLAMLLSMLVFRHKTKHAKFMVGIPVIIILQAIAIWLCFVKFNLF